VLTKPIATKKAVKLVLCGNAAVGKTSITMRYKEGVFKKVHEPTLAGAYQEKKVKTKTGEEIQLNIWDTAGDERFRSIMPLYYRDAEIALLVFDLTDPESFKGIDYWLGELEEKVKAEGMLLCTHLAMKASSATRRTSPRSAGSPRTRETSKHPNAKTASTTRHPH
jgi:small GTP-binding protein